MYLKHSRLINLGWYRLARPNPVGLVAIAVQAPAKLAIVQQFIIDRRVARRSASNICLRVQLTLDLRRTTETSRTRHLFEIETGEGPEWSTADLRARAARTASWIERRFAGFFPNFSSRADTRGRKIRLNLLPHLARGGCVFCRGERSEIFAIAQLAKKPRNGTSVSGLSMLFLVREKVGGRWCLASTAAFYLSVSSRHLTERIQLMIRRERMCVQERNVLPQCERS